MLKTVSASTLRGQIGQVLNEVGYDQAQYIVVKSGHPTAALVSMADFRLLQATQKERATISLKETLSNIRARNRQVDANELNDLIEEARGQFHNLRGRPADAH